MFISHKFSKVVIIIQQDGFKEGAFADDSQIYESVAASRRIFTF